LPLGDVQFEICPMPNLFVNTLNKFNVNSLFVAEVFQLKRFKNDLILMKFTVKNKDLSRVNVTILGWALPLAHHRLSPSKKG